MCRVQAYRLHGWPADWLGIKTDDKTDWNSKLFFWNDDYVSTRGKGLLLRREFRTNRP